MSSPSPAVRDNLIGKLFAGRFQIDGIIGKGGMGSVYRARQMPVGRAVALKVLAGDVPRESEMAKRFVREMKLTSRIEHPNTVQVFDFGQSDTGELYLAMELLEGKTLTKVISAGAIDARRIVTIGAQIAAALSAAHTENIVHRDLKPDNIIVLDRYEKKDWVKVLDFGIAKFHGGDEDSSSLTGTGVLVGTPKFMSPEQATPGSKLDHRSDLYSLGAVLYTMSAGRVPFAGKSAFEILEQHLDKDPEPLSKVVPGRIPPALEELILDLLKKNPNKRPQTAQEVIARLEAIELPEVAVDAATQPIPVQQAPAAGGGNGKVIGLAIGAAALVGAAAYFLLG